MLRTCTSPGCETLTLGKLCLHHEELAKVAALAASTHRPQRPERPGRGAEPRAGAPSVSARR
jgi:hypothetical protein